MKNTQKRLSSSILVFLVLVFLASSFYTSKSRVALQTQQQSREILVSTWGKTKGVSTISMSTETENDTKSSEPLVYHPDGTSYIMCGACKTAYVVEPDQFDNGGQRVRCSVCDKEWFQNSDRVQQTDDEYRLAEMSDAKVAEVKQILADRNFPKYPRGIEHENLLLLSIFFFNQCLILR